MNKILIFFIIFSLFSCSSSEDAVEKKVKDSGGVEKNIVKPQGVSGEKNISSIGLEGSSTTVGNSNDSSVITSEENIPVKEADRGIGVNFVKNKEYKKALEYYNNIYLKDKENIDSIVQLGHINRLMGDYEKGFHYFKIAYEKSGSLKTDERRLLFASYQSGKYEFPVKNICPRFLKKIDDNDVRDAILCAFMYRYSDSIDNGRSIFEKLYNKTKGTKSELYILYKLESFYYSVGDYEKGKGITSKILKITSK